MGHFSGRTRYLFRDAAVLFYIREIDGLWQTEGFVEADEATSQQGERRTLWAKYEASVDWTDSGHLTRVARVFESALHESPSLNTPRLQAALRSDGWQLDDHGVLARLEPAIQPLSGLADLRGAAGIHESFNRIALLLDGDPAGAVGACKELLEATAKTVLEAAGETVDPKMDMPALLGKAQTTLGLSVRGVGVDASPSVKKILGGLMGTAVGLVELRNDEGSGHGRSRGSRLEARHARLALNVSRAWSEIILDTFADPRAPWRRAGT